LVHCRPVFYLILPFENRLKSLKIAQNRRFLKKIVVGGGRLIMANSPYFFWGEIRRNEPCI